MKRYILLSILFLYVSITFAQTQQGIVKTRGRMVNGQLVAGQKLTGATITLNIGNPLVSAADGAFSFNVPSGKNYSLVMAKKQGYTLADPEYTRRSFSYSAENPFYVVLEDEAQRQADVNAATRKVRRTLMAQLQAREDEIEALKEQNKLTEEEYQNRLKVLYDNQSKSEQLVKDIAERYASTDYDQLDDFNRQVQMYIEEGKLQKADSMIRSKGDMEQRVAEYHNVIAANREKQEKLKREQEELELSQSGAQKAYEDLSQDLLRRSEIFLQAFQQDSALYCLKMRADLDTTNVWTAWDYARMCLPQKEYNDCEQYYRRCLIAFENDGNQYALAAIEDNLGELFLNIGDYTKSEYFYKSAYQIREQLYKEDPDENREELGITLLGLGELYYILKNYEYSQLSYKMALYIWGELFKKDPDTYRFEGIVLMQGIADLCCEIQDYENAEDNYLLALRNAERLFENDSNTYRSLLANLQGRLGLFYLRTSDLVKSKDYFLQCIENYEMLFEKNPMAFEFELAMAHCNIGSVFRVLKDYTDSEKHLKYALASVETLFMNDPDIYRSSLATILNDLGFLYCELNEMENSEYYFQSASNHYEILYKQNPEVYAEDFAMNLNNYAYLYVSMDLPEKALTIIDKALSLCPSKVDLYDSKGEILLIQGKNEEALSMWKKVLELKPDFLKDYPDGTNLSNGLKKLGLID